MYNFTNTLNCAICHVKIDIYIKYLWFLDAATQRKGCFLDNPDNPDIPYSKEMAAAELNVASCGRHCRVEGNYITIIFKVVLK